MSIKLSDYEPIVGREIIEELQVLAGKVQGRRLQNVNSTPIGGGVAEILTRMVPLLSEWGEKGHEHVKRNFLITRHLKD
ncbi:MAG: hypothetical protein HY644_04315 [Acidobacteria bacterium]|nr:hypothetical protein [Acidobacteriota bacterium]